MAILDDLAALGADPQDPAAVGAALASLSLSPSGRQQLINEWQAATGLTMPPGLRNRLVAATQEPA